MLAKIKHILKKYENKTIRKDDIKKKIIEDIMKLNSQDLRVFMSMSKRSLSDIEIRIGEKYYTFDIKIYGSGENNTVSNLISINRIKTILENKNNDLIYIFIKYIDGKISSILTQPIYSIQWKHLLIQNLGNGQLQIKNLSDIVHFDNDKDKKVWIEEFKHNVLNFYDKQILKVTENKIEWENAFLDS
jgi:hypothetical protein